MFTQQMENRKLLVSPLEVFSKLIFSYEVPNEISTVILTDLDQEEALRVAAAIVLFKTTLTQFPSLQYTKPAQANYIV